MAAGAGGGQAFTGNVCALLTSAELEQTTGEKFGAPTAGTGNCDWEMASGMGALSLEIKSPGGRQDFVETKQFLGLFQSGLNSLVAPVESQAGSFGLGGAIIGISGQPVPGVGDDAFIGAAGSVIAVKGDTEVTLQLIAVFDSKSQQKGIELTKLVVGRLP